MKFALRIGTLASLMLVLTSPSSAGTIYGPAAAFLIPDPGGSSSTMFVPEITIASLTVEIEIEHTYAGDLFILLQGPFGSAVLLDRPGVPATAFGNGDDLAGVYTFDDLGATFPESAATGTVAPGVYAPHESLSTLAGTIAAGLWTLYVEDFAAVDNGLVQSWSIDVELAPSNPPPNPQPGSVPEPASMTLWGALGLCGLIARRRRRWGVAV